MSTNEKLAAMRLAYAQSAADEFDFRMKEWVESPIEQLLIAQMMVDGWERYSPHVAWTRVFGDIQEAGFKHTGAFLQSDTSPCICVFQAEPTTMPFRIDMAFIGQRMERDRDEMPWVRVAVELDGHDFHERTKEQASRDKRRDRVLAANGWSVLRFTGSDVYRDPAKVLEEIDRVCRRLCWPHMEEPK